MSDPRPWYKKATDWFEENVTSNCSRWTDDLARRIGNGNTESEANIRDAIPWGVAGAIGLSGLLLLDPIQRLTKYIFGFVRKLVTGFGLFEKIPLVGKLFTGLGNMVATIGDYAGYVIPAIAAFIGYKMTLSFNRGSSGTPPALPLELLGNDHHAGRVGDPPVNNPANVFLPSGTTPIAVGTIPTPAPLIPADQQAMAAGNAAGLAELSPAELRRRRTEALLGGNSSNENLIAGYIASLNQLYENRRNWLPAAATYNNGYRNDMRSALARCGLSDYQTRIMTPEAPTQNLRATIHADGSDIPPALQTFAEAFMRCYGSASDQITVRKEGRDVRVFTVVNQTGSTPTAVSTVAEFNNLSITQKMEILQKMVTFLDARHGFFAGRIYTQSYGGHMGGSTTIGIDFHVGGPAAQYLGDGRGFSPALGRDYGMTWQDEYNGFVSLYTPVLRPHGVGYPDTRPNVTGLNQLLAQWRTQRAAADAHIESLTNQVVSGRIGTFEQRVANIQSRLHAIRDHGVAVLYGSGGGNRRSVSLVDCRNPSTPQTISLGFDKQPDGTWKLTDWYNADSTSILWTNLGYISIASGPSFTEEQFQSAIMSGNGVRALIDPLPTLHQQGISIMDDFSHNTRIVGTSSQAFGFTLRDHRRTALFPNDPSQSNIYIKGRIVGRVFVVTHHKSSGSEWVEVPTTAPIRINPQNNQSWRTALDSILEAHRPTPEIPTVQWHRARIQGTNHERVQVTNHGRVNVTMGTDTNAMNDVYDMPSGAHYYQIRYNFGGNVACIAYGHQFAVDGPVTIVGCHLANHFANPNNRLPSNRFPNGVTCMPNEMPTILAGLPVRYCGFESNPFLEPQTRQVVPATTPAAAEWLRTAPARAATTAGTAVATSATATPAANTATPDRYGNPRGQITYDATGTVSIFDLSGQNFYADNIERHSADQLPANATCPFRVCFRDSRRRDSRGIALSCVAFGCIINGRVTITHCSTDEYCYMPHPTSRLSSSIAVAPIVCANNQITNANILPALQNIPIYNVATSQWSVLPAVTPTAPARTSEAVPLPPDDSHPVSTDSSDDVPLAAATPPALIVNHTLETLNPESLRFPIAEVAGHYFTKPATPTHTNTDIPSGYNPLQQPQNPMAIHV